METPSSHQNDENATV